MSRFGAIFILVTIAGQGAFAQSSASPCRQLKSSQAVDAMIQRISDGTIESQLHGEIKDLCLNDLTRVSRGLAVTAQVEFNLRKVQSVHKQQSFQMSAPNELCHGQDPNLDPDKKKKYDHFTMGERLATEQNVISCLSIWFQNAKPAEQRPIARNGSQAVGAVIRPSSDRLQPKENHTHDNLLPDAPTGSAPSSSGKDGSR
jgi:hypothetical protein